MMNYPMRLFTVEISLSGDPAGQRPRKALVAATGQMKAILMAIRTELLPAEEDLIASIRVEEEVQDG